MKYFRHQALQQRQIIIQNNLNIISKFKMRRNTNKKKAKVEKQNVLIPEQILKQMRFNKNFANVYTPYHEFELIFEDLESKKRQRLDRRRLGTRQGLLDQQLQKDYSQKIYEIAQAETLEDYIYKQSSPEKEKERQQIVEQPAVLQRKRPRMQSKAQVVGQKNGVAAPQAEGSTVHDKRRMSKTRAEQWHPKKNQNKLDFDDKARQKARGETQNKFYNLEESHQYGITAQSFSKQERKKNRIMYPAGRLPQKVGSTSSQANYDKQKSSINPVSSLTSFPQRAPSIPEKRQLTKEKNQYDDEEYQPGLGPKKAVQSLGKLNTKSAMRRVDVRRRQLQRNISNDDCDKGILKLEFSEASVENLSLTRQAAQRRNANNSRLNQYRGSHKTNASPLAGNIYFPGRLITTLNNQIQPIQDINYRRNYRREANVGDSRNSLQASQKKMIPKKPLRIKETNLTFFHGSLKRPSQQSEPLDLDLTFLESYYDRQEKATLEKQSVALAHPIQTYVKKRTQQMEKKTELDNNANNFNSMIISGRYIDCGSQRRQRDKRNKQTSQEVMNRRVQHFRVRDDDSLLSEKHKLLMSKGSVQSHSRSPPQHPRQKRQLSKVRFDSPFIGLSDLGNTYYPNIVNVQARVYQRSSQVSNKNNHTLSIFPDTSKSKLMSNQDSGRAHRPGPLVNQLRQSQNKDAGRTGHGSGQRSLEGSPGEAAASSALRVTEIDTPEMGGPLMANNKEPTVVSRVARLGVKANTEDKTTAQGARPQNKFKTQTKFEDKALRKFVRQDTLSLESKRSQQFQFEQRGSKFAQRKDSNHTDQSNERQASHVKQLKEIYNNQQASTLSGKPNQTSYNQPILNLNHEYIQQKRFMVNQKPSRGKLTFNNSRRNINISAKGGPTLQGTPKRKNDGMTNFVKQNKMNVYRDKTNNNVIKSLQEKKANSPTIENQPARETASIDPSESANVYNKSEQVTDSKEQRFLSAQKLLDTTTLQTQNPEVSRDDQPPGSQTHGAAGRGKAESLTVAHAPGKFKLWQSNKQQQAMTKHQSMLPMINGQVQRHGANGIVIRQKQLKQPPPLSNGVANNLYIGAASLTLNNQPHPSKKKSQKEGGETLTAEKNHPQKKDMLGSDVRKYSQSSMAYTATHLKKMKDDTQAQENSNHPAEYGSNKKKDAGSKTQVMFQRVSNHHQKQQQSNSATLKAKPKRQKTLPDQTYVPTRAKDGSIVTSSLATMRQSSNGSVQAQNEYADRGTGVQTKRNKQYLYQMYRSNDQVNESPTTRIAAVSNMSMKQRTNTNMEVSYKAMKQEWRRPAAKLKNKFVKDRIYLPQQMPDIMAANEQATNTGIARSLERHHRDTFMRIKDNSLGSSVQDAALGVSKTVQKKSEGLILHKNKNTLHNRTSMQNYKQNRMFYYNHAREEGLRADRPGDLNHSLNFAHNNRTHADNFISNVGGQNTYNVTLSQLTDRSSKAVNQFSVAPRTMHDGQTQPHVGHRQQRSQLGMQSFIHGGHNQIYYNESLRDHKHMSLPYLNDNKSRQNQVNQFSSKMNNSGPNRAPINMVSGTGEEQRAHEARPISNLSQVRNRNADPAISRRSNGPQPQFSVEHSDVINRMNSDGSTVSEIHHHVHHHYNHTHIHHHHNDGSASGQATPFIMAGGAAVPSAGVSSHNVSHNVQNDSPQQLMHAHEKVGVYRDD